MASMKATFVILFILSFVLPHGIRAIRHHNHHSHGVESIYQFGDSLSDTGNLIRDNPIGAHSTFASSPYGQTFFHHPTGRCSDGLLMIDYFAKNFKLPFLDPYLKKDGNFAHGVNFAVAGSTALDASTLAAKNILLPVTNSSLLVQLKWFRSHLDSICSNPSDCKKKLRNALFVVGETGGNDFNYALFQRKSIEDLQNMVPEVVQTIKNTVTEVINFGAVRVVVSGNFPIGCMPIYLASFKSDDPTMYDELKCLKGLNDFARFENAQVQQAVKELQQKYPHVAIIYADYFYALQQLLHFRHMFGFDKNATQKTCCGSGDNEYNFNLTSMCGIKGTSVCPHPRSRIHWDGVHLTSHAYQRVAKTLLKQIVNGISHLA